MTMPIALTIAGSDSSGGAGIQADLKTFAAHQVYGASVIVALTAQNTQAVRAIHPVPADFVAAQIDAVFEDLDVAAVKIGMLATAELIETVADGLERHGARNIVLDPVMIAASGGRLLQEDAIEALKRRLLPLATLVTPNLPEAAALLGTAMAQTEEAAAEQGSAIAALGAANVLVKGGHASGADSVDVLVSQGGQRQRFVAPRIETLNTHGTGCTLSSAIASGLAHGIALDEAVSLAKRYISSAIAASDEVRVGHGHGPVHHFHHWWDRTDGRDR
ncbi:bifunctional hydroxymethylpyrimidine kinase/phosphomethylpyrimidine kinase [Bosea sp. (in: a-proteobacteria)]|jgi:hydroxymethylpyrimidine/phosphomethylpyrimidine kinase|uniref:bifunctional hydroxymethylpyrimidine kinase/phosphomethylpyrimidine kinase n=1 Tax=Bosea sp. (in: a-proteobacteria) TaxID=1871050 RepID=UPI001AC13C70|nr:bifunctional hydroxymethylpyrimidine kinase/phosphomethylpyrimidine kinase [Bosea sp. (in: a-proteobacteria)]MBN9440840.1 bifunctional hydroxymethylpyrimidine kinase/phosphomethylpyrimidine kinase [Bosea sp. (in: a-proteobacteria)]